MAFYRYIPRRLLSPGTGNYAFLPATGLPLSSVLGAGSGLDRQMFVTSVTPQVYHDHAQTIQGLEGIETGTMQTSSGLVNMADYLSGVTTESGLV